MLEEKKHSLLVTGIQVLAVHRSRDINTSTPLIRQEEPLFISVPVDSILRPSACRIKIYM